MKKHVRISPLMLGKLGDIAAQVTRGAVIVQFAGRSARFDDGDEWQVTHAVLSNSLDVVDGEARQAHNQQVDQVVHVGGLSHIGWLRQVSDECPVSALDIDTQRVYETHTRDAFAAMLDISDSPSGPCLFLYCLAGGPAGTRFMAASHVILDSTIPYTIISGSSPLLPSNSGSASPQFARKRSPSKLSDGGCPSGRNSSDSSASDKSVLDPTPMDLSR